MIGFESLPMIEVLAAINAVGLVLWYLLARLEREERTRLLLQHRCNPFRVEQAPEDRYVSEAREELKRALEGRE